jgi:hypothetical protein
MHLTLSAPCQSEEPRSPTEVSDGLQLKEALFLQQDSRLPRCLVSYYPLGLKEGTRILSSGSKRKEPVYVCLSEVKSSLRLKTRVNSGFTTVLRYTIHFSQMSRQMMAECYWVIYIWWLSGTGWFIYDGWLVLADLYMMAEWYWLAYIWWLSGTGWLMYDGGVVRAGLCMKVEG